MTEHVSLYDALHRIAFGDDAIPSSPPSGKVTRGAAANAAGEDDDDWPAPADDGSAVAWDEAERQLVARLQRGELTAWGKKLGYRGYGQMEQIPRGFWIYAEQPGTSGGLTLLPVKGQAFYEDEPERGEWSDIAFDRREVLRPWPAPLGAIRYIEEASPADPSTVETTGKASRRTCAMYDPFYERYWNLTQVLIWVSTGSRSFVEHARGDTARDHTANAIELIGRAIIETGLRSSFGDYEDAMSDLMARMRNGDLRVWGRQNGAGVREIAAHEMYGVQLYPGGLIVPPSSNWPPGRSKPHVGRPEPDATFWSDPLFEVEEVLRLWPNPLEEALPDAGDPREVAIEHGRVTVENTRPWWSLTAVLAWVIGRDPAVVSYLCRPRSVVAKGAVMLRLLKRGGKTLDKGRRELFDALGAGEVTAHGNRGDGLEIIPAVQWSSPTNCTFVDGGDRVGLHRDVVIFGADVLRRWPALPGAVAPATATVESEARTRRGYARRDQALMPDMKKLVDDGMSPWAAAQKLADSANGGGTPESKAKRLVGRFKEFENSQNFLRTEKN